MNTRDNTPITPDPPPNLRRRFILTCSLGALIGGLLGCLVGLLPGLFNPTLLSAISTTLLGAVVGAAVAALRITNALAALVDAMNAGDAAPELDDTLRRRLGAGGAVLLDAHRRNLRQIDYLKQQLAKTSKLASFGELGAGMTHEIKNPMTGIVGFAQLAQRRLDDQEKLLELLQFIETEALRGRDILMNYLKFARESDGSRHPRDINAIVASTAAMLRHQLGTHGIKLETQLADNLPEIECNENEIIQVLVNLSLNAQQAIGENGVVTMRTEAADNGGVRIGVCDNGPGIPADIREHIFDPFFTTKAKGVGTGLGLSVSQNLLNAIGGRIVLESTSESGTCFTVWLPGMPPANAQIDEPDADVSTA